MWESSCWSRRLSAPSSGETKGGGSSAEETLQVAQVIGQGGGQHRERRTQRERARAPFRPPAPPRPHHHERAEDDRRGDQQLVEGDHRGRLTRERGKGGGPVQGHQREEGGERDDRDQK